MFPDTPSPSLSTITAQSWTQDSTIDVDDAQPQTLSESDAPGSSTVFEEKKWIVSEVGDTGTPFFSHLCRSSIAQDPFKVVSFVFKQTRLSSHLTKRRYRRSFLSFFFSSSDRTVSRRTGSFLTLTSIPLRRQREVCASLRIVVSPHCQTLTSLALPRLASHHPPPLPAYVLPTHQSGRMSLPILKCGPPSPTRTTWRCPSIPFARGRLGSYGRSSYPVSTSFSIFDTPASASVRFVPLFSPFFFPVFLWTFPSTVWENCPDLNYVHSLSPSFSRSLWGARGLAQFPELEYSEFP